MNQERMIDIYDKIKEHPRISIEELSDEFSLPEREIRIIVKELEKRGFLREISSGEFIVAKDLTQEDLQTETGHPQIPSYVAEIQTRLEKAIEETSHYKDDLLKFFEMPADDIVKRYLEIINNHIDHFSKMYEKTRREEIREKRDILKKDLHDLRNRFRIIEDTFSRNIEDPDLSEISVVGSGVASVSRIRISPMFFFDFFVTAGCSKKVKYLNGEAVDPEEILDPRFPQVAEQRHVEELTTAFPTLDRDDREKIAKALSQTSHYELNRKSIDSYRPDLIFQKGSILPPDHSPLDLQKDIRREHTWRCIQAACDLADRSKRMGIPVVGSIVYSEQRRTSIFTRLVRGLLSENEPEKYFKIYPYIDNCDGYIFDAICRDSDRGVSWAIKDNRIYAYFEPGENMDRQFKEIPIKKDAYMRSIEMLNPCFFFVKTKSGRGNFVTRYEIFSYGINHGDLVDNIQKIASLAIFLGTPVTYDGSAPNLVAGEKPFTVLPSLVSSATKSAQDHANYLINTVVERLVSMIETRWIA